MIITELTRRDIIDYLLVRGKPFYGKLDLVGFLKRVWDLSSMPSTDGRFENAEGDIWQHMINNSDWDEDFLLSNYLKLFECPETIFLKFIEQVVHPVVLRERDASEVKQVVDELNKYLEPDGYRLDIDSQISGRGIYKAKRIGENKENMPGENAYEVALSFAGEDRDYVEKVAAYLKKKNIRFFYDKYEEATLWGKDLVEHLDKVFRGDARYCVMFISKHYKEKIWPSHERGSALAKALELEEKGEYILPARFDKTELPGLRPTICYVDLQFKSPNQLGDLIMQKLGRIKQ